MQKLGAVGLCLMVRPRTVSRPSCHSGGVHQMVLQNVREQSAQREVNGDSHRATSVVL